MAEKELSCNTEDLDRSFGERLEIHILPALEQLPVGGSQEIILFWTTCYFLGGPTPCQ